MVISTSSQVDRLCENWKIIINTNIDHSTPPDLRRSGPDGPIEKFGDDTAPLLIKIIVIRNLFNRSKTPFWNAVAFRDSVSHP
jgi:hypothetical protein